MEKIIAYCGIECSQCPAFIAKKENNDELRKKTAEQWSKEFKHTVMPENINCDGCLSTTGQLIQYCNICEIRKCGFDKKVQNCSFCDDYVCEKLEKWFESVPDAKKRLDEIRKNR